MLIDAVFVLLLFIACFKGYQKGLIVAVFSLLAFVIGLAAALKLSATVADKLASGIHISGKWLPVISFISVFLIVVILVNLLAKLIQQSVELVLLGWVNRIGGILFFVLLYSFIYSIFLFYLVQLKMLKPAVTSESKCYFLIQPLGPFVINKIGVIFPFFADMFSQLQEFFNRVFNKIQH